MGDTMGRYACNQGFAASIVECGAVVDEIAGRQHGLEGEPLAMVGEAIAAALLLATRLKGRGLLTLGFESSGSMPHLRVDVMGLDRVRAMVPPACHESLATWDGRAPLLGPGRLVVSRQLEGQARPYQSSIAIDGGRPAALADRYLRQSDQVEARLAVRVAPGGPPGRVRGAYVERLPGEEQEHPAPVPDPVTLLDAGPDDPEPLPGFRRLHVHDIGFHCPCSRDRFLKTLSGFPRDELQTLTDGNGVIVTDCDFCRTRYDIPLDEVL